MLRTYVTNTCKSRYIFPNFLTRFVFFIIFFSFLFRHFTSVDEPTLDLNFYNYSTITFYNYSTIARIFSHTDYIDSYEKYFFKLEALRKDLENIHITLFSKKDLNLPTLCIDLFTYFYTLYIDFCTNTKKQSYLRNANSSIQLHSPEKQEQQKPKKIK